MAQKANTMSIGGEATEYGVPRGLDDEASRELIRIVYDEPVPCGIHTRAVRSVAIYGCRREYEQHWKGLAKLGCVMYQAHRYVLTDHHNDPIEQQESNSCHKSSRKRG